LYREVKAFQLKLALFSKQLNEHKIVHFPHLKAQIVTQVLTEKHSSQLMAFQQEYIKRFVDFKAIWDSSNYSAHLLSVTLKPLPKNCKWNWN